MASNFLIEGPGGVWQIKAQGGYNSKLPITTTGLVTAGSLTVTGAISLGAQTITSTSANALTVGPNGLTNPTLNIDANETSAATGLNVEGFAAGSGVNLEALSSGTNESINLVPKGSGNVTMTSNGTGASLQMTDSGGTKIFLRLLNSGTDASPAARIDLCNNSSSPTLQLSGSNSSVVAIGAPLLLGAASGGTAVKINSGSTFNILDTGTVTGAAGAATLNKTCGIVTTETLTTAASGKSTYTITNSQVAATDIVLTNVSTTGTGTATTGSVTPGAGSFTVELANVSTGAAFNAALKIYFTVIKTS